MRHYRSTYYFDAAVILVSVFLYVGIANMPFKAKPFGDKDFHTEAKIIAKYMWGRESFESVSITKAPGPVLFYLIPYVAVGPDATNDQYWFAGIIWTGLFITMSLFLIKRAGNNFGNPLAGRISVILLLLVPLQVYYSLGILAEGMAFFGCCMMIYGYSVVTKNDRILQLSDWWPFGVGIVLIILARPNIALLLPLSLLFVFWQIWVRKIPFFIKIAKQFFIVWTISVFILASISLLVKQLPNKRTTLNQEGYLGFVAVIGRFQFREEPWDWRFWDNDIRPDSKDYQNWQNKVAEIDTLSDGSEEMKYKNYIDYVVSDVIHHPFNAIKQFFIRAVFGHTLQVNSLDKSKFGVGLLKGEWVYWSVHILLNTFNILILIFSIWYMFTKGIFSNFGLIIIPWIALVLFHGFVYMEQRYLFPVRPVMILLASFFISTYFEPVLKKKYPQLLK